MTTADALARGGTDLLDMRLNSPGLCEFNALFIAELHSLRRLLNCALSCVISASQFAAQGYCPVLSSTGRPTHALVGQVNPLCCCLLVALGRLSHLLTRALVGSLGCSGLRRTAWARAIWSQLQLCVPFHGICSILPTSCFLLCTPASCCHDSSAVMRVPTVLARICAVQARQSAQTVLVRASSLPWSSCDL